MNDPIDSIDCILEKVASVLDDYSDLKRRYHTQIKCARENKVDISLEDNFIENLITMLDRQNIIIMELNEDFQVLIDEINYKRLIMENKSNIARQINEKVMNKFLEKMYQQENVISELTKQLEISKKTCQVSMTSPERKGKMINNSGNSLSRNLRFDGYSVEATAEEKCEDCFTGHEGQAIRQKIQSKAKEKGHTWNSLNCFTNSSYDSQIANTVSNECTWNKSPMDDTVARKMYCTTIPRERKIRTVSNISVADTVGRIDNSKSKSNRNRSRNSPDKSNMYVKVNRLKKPNLQKFFTSRNINHKNNLKSLKMKQKSTSSVTHSINNSMVNSTDNGFKRKRRNLFTVGKCDRLHSITNPSTSQENILLGKGIGTDSNNHNMNFETEISFKHLNFNPRQGSSPSRYSNKNPTSTTSQILNKNYQILEKYNKKVVQHSSCSSLPSEYLTTRQSDKDKSKGVRYTRDTNPVNKQLLRYINTKLSTLTQPELGEYK